MVQTLTGQGKATDSNNKAATGDKAKKFRPQVGQEVTCLTAIEARCQSALTKTQQEFQPGMKGVVTHIDIPYVFALRKGRTRECGHRCTVYANIEFTGDDGETWRVTLDYHNIAAVVHLPDWCADEDSLYQLLDKRRWNECEQHIEQLRAVSALIVRHYPNLRFSSASASEVVESEHRQCHIEVEVRLGKGATRQARSAFVAEAEALGWQEVSHPFGRGSSLWLSGSLGVRLKDGSIPASDGELRYAIIETRREDTPLFGEFVSEQMVGKPHLKFRRTMMQNDVRDMRRIGRDCTLRYVRWQDGAWVIEGEVGAGGDADNKTGEYS